jgi:ubiquinone/menaquinone biosynthesis C-methylase UbiE
MASVARKLVNKAIEEYSKEMRGKVLFVGVSRAYHELYSKMFDEFVTLDINQKMKPDIVGDIQNCPQIPSGSYDGVIITGVWEYIGDHDKAILEIFRILKSDNSALICLPGAALYHDKPTVKLKDVASAVFPLRVDKVEIVYYKNQILPFYLATFVRKC